MRRTRRTGPPFRRSEDRPRPEMHIAACSRCGEEFELPFKPNGTRPVFCSRCYKKPQEHSSPSSSSSDLDMINRKLDKIMRALKID